MKKLLLKHLTTYLPYEVKIGDNRSKLIFEKSLDFQSAEFLIQEKSNDSIKIVLRPLSDLIEGKWNNIFISKDIDEILTKYQSDKNLDCVEYYLVNILISHHFDIFGLIEKDLAIDINTLK